MKIKFDSDDNLPLNTVLKFRILTIVKGVFLKNTINIIQKFF